ncbi:MAG: hypothetical protein ACE5DT_00045 [Nitrosopumilus sp.]
MRKSMTKLMTTLTISVIASILIIGGFAITPPNAFSTYNNHDGYDDCENDSYGHHDDCGEDKPDDPCDCEKPDTLKFIFSAPTGEELSEFRIEVFKKLENINNPDKKLTSINDVASGIGYQLLSSSFGKDKLNSNTAFAIYKVVEGLDDQLVASMEIHTSCSQPLFKGLTVSNNGYSLGITDGLKNDKTSIPEFDPLICEDQTKPEQMGNIVIRKAITNDNGGNATPEDFTITLTNVETNEAIILVHDQDNSIDSAINVNEVPVGTYKISETTANTVIGTYTTVLIAGDTKCPAMIDEPFTIKKGKTLSCTIYNDDNGTGGSGEGGIIFRNFSMQVKLGDKMMADSCDAITNAADKNACIEIVNPSDGRFAIVDSALTSDTTIVLFSVLQAGQLETDNGAISPACDIEAIVQHDKPSFFLVDQSDNESFPTNPSTNNVVVVKCTGTNMNSVYNVNYVMIDPTL